MPAPGHKSISLKAYSLEKLKVWIEKQKKKGNTTLSPPDVIDKLITNFLIELGEDAEAGKIEDAAKRAASKTSKQIP